MDTHGHSRKISDTQTLLVLVGIDWSLMVFFDDLGRSWLVSNVIHCHAMSVAGSLSLVPLQGLDNQKSIIVHIDMS